MKNSFSLENLIFSGFDLVNIDLHSKMSIEVVRLSI